jgi:hypothetical protein
MIYNKKSSLILMVQSSHKLFCYSTITAMDVKELRKKYQESLCKGSKPALKVFLVENGIAKEIKTISIDMCEDSWYIDMDRGDVDVFVELGKLFPDDTFYTLATSNIVTTPREHNSVDTGVYFVDISKNEKNLKAYPEIIVGNKECNSGPIDEYFEEIIKKYTVYSSKIK